MFGLSKIRKCSDHVYFSIQPILSQVQSIVGLPKGFWEDAYVVGFFGFLVSFHTNMTSGLNLNETQKGQVLSDVFQRFSNRPGELMTMRFNELFREKDDDFELGQEHASALCFASIGKGTPESAPFIENAKRDIRGSGFTPSIGSIFSVMFCDLFLAEIVKRFELDTNDADAWTAIEHARASAISGQ